MPAINFFAATALLAAAWAELGELDELDKDDVWVQALEECGEDGRDEDVAMAVRCQERAQAAYDSDAGAAGFQVCDEQYCDCVRGTWNPDGTCAVSSSVSCTEDCECMEQCYAQQLRCAFDHTVSLYSSLTDDVNSCEISKMRECVAGTWGDLVKECKRGLAKSPAVLTWMAQPVPQGCDPFLVCSLFLSLPGKSRDTGAGRIIK
eukprot:gene13092-20199_t